MNPGDLVFLSDYQNDNPDPSTGSVSTIYQAIYLRELTVDELSSLGLDGPASWVTFPTVLDPSTPLMSSIANNLIAVNDAKIIGTVITGIDTTFLAPVTVSGLFISP